MWQRLQSLWGGLPECVDGVDSGGISGGSAVPSAAVYFFMKNIHVKQKSLNFLDNCSLKHENYINIT
jgi:hypothetical protein